MSAPIHPGGTAPGHCICWLARWFGLDMYPASRMNLSAVAKKNEIKPWRVKEWVISEASAEFVCAMEEVLDVCQGHNDPRRLANDLFGSFQVDMDSYRDL